MLCCITTSPVALSHNEVFTPIRTATRLVRHRTLTRILWLNIGLLAFAYTAAIAQQDPEKLRAALQDDVYTIVEKAPEFPRGIPAMRDYLKQNVQYPAEARKAGVKGHVFVNFIVETDGRLTDINIIKRLGAGCDEETLRVVKAMPRWKPGSQSGRSVRVRYNLSIQFGLDYPKPKGN